MIRGVKVFIYLCILFLEKFGIKFLNKMFFVVYVYVGFGV